MAVEAAEVADKADNSSYEPGSVGESMEAVGPLMLGRVAYCSQVPWIVAGTVRVSKRILSLLIACLYFL